MPSYMSITNNPCLFILNNVSDIVLLRVKYYHCCSMTVGLVFEVMPRSTLHDNTARVTIIIVDTRALISVAKVAKL